MLAVFSADGRFVRVNHAWEVTLGYPAGDLIGRPLFDLIHPDDLERTIAAAELHFGEGQRVQAFQNRYRHLDGTYRWLEWMSRMAPDNSIAFSVARDITDRKTAEERRAKRHQVLQTRNETLSQRTVRDPLTDLHNRRHFDASVVRLQRCWTRLPIAKRPPVSVVLFDLDDFGQLNKLYGHQAGDVVLRLFAGLLKERFRESDLIARYGGEEFVAGQRRADIADRIAGLQALDERLGGLERHLDRPRRSLAVLDMDGPCCEAANAVVGSAEGRCVCCSPAAVGGVT